MDVSGGILQAGYPRRHDENLYFHPSMGERKLMNHFVVRVSLGEHPSLQGKTCSEGKSGFFYAFLQLAPVFLSERRALPTREAFDGQTAHAHQFAEYAPSVGSQKSAYDLHEPGQEVMLLLRRLEIARFQRLVHADAGFRKRSRWRVNRPANAD